MPEQLPIALNDGDKRGLRTQFGALPYRIKGGKVEVLLITTRRSGRWIIPKGWPVNGETPADAAAAEAFEEAGVKGEISNDILGFFTYDKLTDDNILSCLVAVFALEVTESVGKYREAKQRERIWVSRKKAARMVDEPMLKLLLRGFSPSVAKSSSKLS